MSRETFTLQLIFAIHGAIYMLMGIAIGYVLGRRRKP